MAKKKEENLETLRHSVSHIMADAVKKLYPGVKLGIGPAIEDGFYYDFDFSECDMDPSEGGRFLTPDDLPRIEKEMARIIKENIPFEKQEVSKKEAEKIFAEHLRRWPQDRARCTWAKSIVKARLRLGRKQPTLEALKLMLKTLTALRGRYGAKRFAVVSCRKTIRGLLGGLARRWRVEAHVTKNRTTAALAQRAEQLYLKVFRSRP